MVLAFSFCYDVFRWSGKVGPKSRCPMVAVDSRPDVCVCLSCERERCVFLSNERKRCVFEQRERGVCF